MFHISTITKDVFQQLRLPILIGLVNVRKWVYSRWGTWWGNIVLPHLARWRSKSVANKHWPVRENAKCFHASKWSNKWSQTSAMTPYTRRIMICFIKRTIKIWKKFTGWGSTAFCPENDGVSFMEGCGNIAASDRLVGTCCLSIVLLSSATKHFLQSFTFYIWRSIYGVLYMTVPMSFSATT